MLAHWIYFFSAGTVFVGTKWRPDSPRRRVQWLSRPPVFPGWCVFAFPSSSSSSSLDSSAFWLLNRKNKGSSRYLLNETKMWQPESQKPNYSIRNSNSNLQTGLTWSQFFYFSLYSMNVKGFVYWSTITPNLKIPSELQKDGKLGMLFPILLLLEDTACYVGPSSGFYRGLWLLAEAFYALRAKKKAFLCRFSLFYVNFGIQ